MLSSISSRGRTAVGTGGLTARYVCLVWSHHHVVWSHHHVLKEAHSHALRTYYCKVVSVREGGRGGGQWGRGGGGGADVGIVVCMHVCVQVLGPMSRSLQQA